MRSLFFLFLFFGTTPLMASYPETDGAHDVIMRGVSPLTIGSMKGVLRSFRQTCRAHSPLLPEDMSLKKQGLFFEFESYMPHYGSKKIFSQMTRRDTKLLIKFPIFNKAQRTFCTVGQILLIEYPQQETHKFSLHFINIFKEHQSDGFGGSALDLTILLAQHLSQQSSFYDRLTLQCADYDGTKHLGNVPYRLSYYLNHGFQIAPQTVTFMRHLDVAYFIHSLNNTNFITFLKSYARGAYGTVDLPLDTFLDKADLLLEILKSLHPIQRVNLDGRCLEIAEKSSSDAGLRILDRLFYDPTLSDEFYEKQIEGQIYVMTLDIADWSKNLRARQKVKRARAASLQTHPYNSEELNFLLRKIANIYKDLKQATIGIRWS